MNKKLLLLIVVVIAIVSSTVAYILLPQWHSTSWPATVTATNDYTELVEICSKTCTPVFIPTEDITMQFTNGTSFTLSGSQCNNNHYNGQSIILTYHWNKYVNYYDVSPC